MSLLDRDHLEENFLDRLDTVEERLAELERESSTGMFEVNGTLMTVPGAVVSGDIIGARAYNSGNISIPNDTSTALTFDTERWDTDDIHDLSTNTGRLTCVTAGYYLIIGQVSFDSDADGYRFVIIWLNETTSVASQRLGANPSGATRVEVMTIYELAVGDYVELQVRHTAGAALDVVAGSAYSPEFMMVRLV